MSRIGRMPIALPPGVVVNIKDNEVAIRGPKGELHRHLRPEVSVTLDNSSLVVSRPSDGRLERSLHGLTRTLLANMVEGVTKGFDKYLEITGVGYRAEKAGDKLLLRLGFSHPVEVAPLAGVSLAVEANNRIKVSGIDKEMVGQMAASIRAIRPPDTYKSKGIKYAGELTRLKPGKAGKAIGSKQ
ncbi:MAG: large subunit ribosomal protein [Dehalococcoidales bacterium]|nr:large subunit ribosomal protein [Dehalococcoidales bacterium]